MFTFSENKISGATKLFCIFSNITFSPCNHMEFIFMASDQILPIPILIYSRACVLHMRPSLVVTVLLSEDACRGDWGHALHTVSSHPPFPFGAEALGFFKAKFIFFWKKHLALWQHHRNYLGCLRVSPVFITWFRYWKGSWHFNVLVSGHEECEKAEVCLHLQSLFEICKAENNFFLKKCSCDLCYTCIYGWFFYCLILIST